jgi:hypothetical protein
MSTALRQIMQGFSFSCNKTESHSYEACRLGMVGEGVSDDIPPSLKSSLSTIK